MNEEMEESDLCSSCLNKDECHSRDVENGRSMFLQDQFEYCMSLGYPEYIDDDTWIDWSLSDGEPYDSRVEDR